MKGRGAPMLVQLEAASNREGFPILVQLKARRVGMQGAFAGNFVGGSAA